MNVHRTLALLAFFVSAGCAGSNESSQNASTAAPADATEVALANLAERQRTCIDALKAHLTALKVTRIDVFLGQTLNGLVICDATNGFSHLPTRDVTTWLNAADGKPHANVPVPDQPAEITTLPHDGPGRVRYQQHCIAWMHRYLPASIAHNGDDPDTAAADVFNGIEECDAVAGLATISREQLAGWVKSKNLN